MAILPQFEMEPQVEASIIQTELKAAWESNSKVVHQMARRVREWRKQPLQSSKAEFFDELKFLFHIQLCQYGRVQTSDCPRLHFGRVVGCCSGRRSNYSDLTRVFTLKGVQFLQEFWHLHQHMECT